MKNTYVFEDYPVKLCLENFDDDKKELKNKFIATYPDLENRFEIKSVSYNEIKIYYSKCDVFSLPSLNEPFGIAYLEALASNKPIVAPDDKNRREIIGNAGIYCDVTNSQEYAKALVNAINVRWNDIPRKRAELFNWDKIALKYVEVIESLMNLEGFDK